MSSPTGVVALAQAPADRPAERTDANSRTAHAELLAKDKSGRVDVYFIGDSITRRWGALNCPELLANWRKNFFGWNAADFGWGGDRPPAFGPEAAAENIARGVEAVLQAMRARAPEAVVILTAVFPRNDNMAVLPTVRAVNRKPARWVASARRRDRLQGVGDVAILGVELAGRSQLRERSLAIPGAV